MPFVGEYRQRRVVAAIREKRNGASLERHALHAKCNSSPDNTCKDSCSLHSFLPWFVLGRKGRPSASCVYTLFTCSLYYYYYYYYSFYNCFLHMVRSSTVQRGWKCIIGSFTNKTPFWTVLFKKSFVPVLCICFSLFI